MDGKMNCVKCESSNNNAIFKNNYWIFNIHARSKKFKNIYLTPPVYRSYVKDGGKFIETLKKIFGEEKWGAIYKDESMNNS